jgi:hypothetical protein
MTQHGFDWDPAVNLPVQGHTPEARHAGRTGAERAAKDRGALSLQYRQLLITVGPLSDHEAAKALGRLVSSINSTRNGWGDKVQPSGQFEDSTYHTKRVKWRWVA